MNFISSFGDRLKICRFWQLLLLILHLRGTGRDEPMLMAIELWKRKNISILLWDMLMREVVRQCNVQDLLLLFREELNGLLQVMLHRSVPFDFPTAAGVVLRPDFKEITLDEAFEMIAGYDIQKEYKILYLYAESDPECGRR